MVIWLHWLDSVEIGPEWVAIAACAVPGALVLTQYTRHAGVFGYVVNLLLLFAAADVSILLTRDLVLDLGFLQRVLIISVGGMMAVAMLMLLLFPRSKRG